MSQKYKIELSIKAKEDIKDLLIYIKGELNEPTIASKYSKIIKEELKTLAYLPQKFAIIDDETIKDLRIRKLSIKNHCVDKPSSKNPIMKEIIKDFENKKYH